MHELSIAQNIVAIAEKEVIKADARRVERIEMDIGKLSGIEIDALDFVWQAAVQESVLEDAMKIINPVRGKGLCMKCNQVFSVDQLFDLCPECEGYLDMLEGRELKIKSLTLI